MFARAKQLTSEDPTMKRIESTLIPSLHENGHPFSAIAKEPRMSKGASLISAYALVVVMIFPATQAQAKGSDRWQCNLTCDSKPRITYVCEDSKASADKACKDSGKGPRGACRFNSSKLVKRSDASCKSSPLSLPQRELRKNAGPLPEAKKRSHRPPA